MSNQSTSEADMGYVRDFVQKIAEALVSATELPKQIEAIQASMTTLSSDLERTKARNIELDTLLNDTRRQRDEAEQALSQAKKDLSETGNRYNDVEAHNSSLTGLVNSLREELSKAKSERDDYGLQAMSAEDRAKTAEDKLAKLADALGLPKAQPQSVVAQPEVKPVVPEAPPATPNPAPVVEQAIPNSPKRVYEGDFGFNELRFDTEAWDPIVARYYRTT